MSSRKKLTQSGMTLVELNVALVITTMLVAVIVSFALDKLRQSSLQMTQDSLLTTAETGLNVVANDVRLSTLAETNNRWQDQNAPSAPSNLLSWASGSTTLVLATAAQNSSRTVLFDDAHNYVSSKNNVIYFVKSGTLYKRILAAPVTGNAAKTTCPAASATSSCPADRTILTNVTSFSVQYYDGDNQIVAPANARSVQLSVTLSKPQYGETPSVSYTTRMVFRNG